jgi:hypothetical protein
MTVAADVLVTARGDLVLAVVRRSGQSTDIDLYRFDPSDQVLQPLFSAGGTGPPEIGVSATATVIHSGDDGETEYEIRATATYATTWLVDLVEVG